VNLVGNAAFRIGLWRVDPALDEISRAGTTIKLEPRTMRVLVCLAEHGGEVVSVNQLLDTVWKDLVVTQYSVYQAIAVLRRALGDDPKNPTYIASVLRRGYRLIAPIEPDANTHDPLTLPGEASAPGDTTERPGSVLGEAPPVEPEAPADRQAVQRHWDLRSRSILISLLILAAGLWLSLRLGHEHPAVGSAANAPEATSDGFTPPPHSVAVLPFTNLSGDPKQEYFSDGMTDELINALAQVDALRVIARTSSFSFKGKDADIGTIARKLNVAVVLEGSVRRSGNKVRITAQLIDGVNGFHTWSQDYDRDLNNVLTLQTDIATAVAHELRAKLLGDEAPKIELGGTRNSGAFDAYLRGAKAYGTERAAQDFQTAITAYTEAIRLDPKYALAFAARSVAYSGYASKYATGAAVREAFDNSQTDARQALALAPELAEGHLAMGRFLDSGPLDFAQAGKAYEQALALAPGNAEIVRASGNFALLMGNVEAGLAAIHRAIELDPLNPRSHVLLGYGLYIARRYQESTAAFAEAISLDPEHTQAYAFQGLAHYALGNLQEARSSCETKRDYWLSQWCLAVVYHKLGRHPDAESEFAKLKAGNGDDAALQYAEIYAQWDDRAKALDWLDTALRLRDPGLEFLKTDPLVDPLRGDPRFQAIVRQLKFPD